jgi:hypothetical protein
MKITGFCPIIVTKDQDAVIATFEALGFEKRHTKTDIEGGNNVGVAMKDADGNRISIASTTKDRADITAILINVDNFREAYDFFIGKGFIDPRENKTTVTGSDEATMLISPSGFPVVISEHFNMN